MFIPFITCDRCTVLLNPREIQSIEVYSPQQPVKYGSIIRMVGGKTHHIDATVAEIERTLARPPYGVRPQQNQQGWEKDGAGRPQIVPQERKTS
ncbi:hypothetical protein [Rhodococcus koreensis]